MRLLLLIAIGTASFLSLRGDPAPIDYTAAYTLTSVANPGWVLTETKGLCHLAPGGSAIPLHLKIVSGLASNKCVSLTSATEEGYVLRHQDSQIKLHPYPENDGLFARDASFYLIRNPDGSVSFRSYNYPKQYITVTAAKELYISTDPELPYRSFFLTN